jgi:hypothetical protein
MLGVTNNTSMLFVVMLNVVILSVVMLSVVAPFLSASHLYTSLIFARKAEAYSSSGLQSNMERQPRN